MMLHKNSSRASLLKLLALTPIVGMTLALNAETVNDYVYEQPQNQTKAKVVKKGNQDAKVKVGAKTVEVKAVKPAAKAQAKKDATVKNVVVKAKKDAAVKDVVVKAKKTEDVVTGTNDNEKPEPLFDVVEEMPKFPGGDEGLMSFLKDNIKYPAEAEKAGKQGRVVVTFVVNKDGSVDNAKVVRSVDEKLDAEALRVVNAMPKWQPGKQRGQDVNVRYTLPVTFKLNKPAEKK